MAENPMVPVVAIVSSLLGLLIILITFNCFRRMKKRLRHKYDQFYCFIFLLLMSID